MIIDLDYWGRLPVEGARVTAGVGPDARLYVLMRASGGRWRVLALHPDGWHAEMTADAHDIGFDLVQPLDDGLILASSRSARGIGGMAPNAVIYDSDGRAVREIVLGGGIADMQTTAGGGIWVSYHDQGFFPGTSTRGPLHLPGLILFDRNGGIVFRFPEAIVECYSLNVTGEHDLWAYCYPEFPILHLADTGIARQWTSPIQGAQTMAIWRDVLLMQAGYGSGEARVVKLGDRAEIIGEPVSFRTADRRHVPGSQAYTRGDAMWFILDGEVHLLSLRERLHLLVK